MSREYGSMDMEAVAQEELLSRVLSSEDPFSIADEVTALAPGTLKTLEAENLRTSQNKLSMQIHTLPHVINSASEFRGLDMSDQELLHDGITAAQFEIDRWMRHEGTEKVSVKTRVAKRVEAELSKQICDSHGVRRIDMRHVRSYHRIIQSIEDKLNLDRADIPLGTLVEEIDEMHPEILPRPDRSTWSFNRDKKKRKATIKILKTIHTSQQEKVSEEEDIPKVDEPVLDRSLESDAALSNFLVAMKAARINDRNAQIFLRVTLLDETLEDVGREFGITRERARQINAGVVRRLKHPGRRVKSILTAEEKLTPSERVVVAQHAEKEDKLKAAQERLDKVVIKHREEQGWLEESDNFPPYEPPRIEKKVKPDKVRKRGSEEKKEPTQAQQPEQPKPRRQEPPRSEAQQTQSESTHDPLEGLKQKKEWSVTDFITYAGLYTHNGSILSGGNYPEQIIFPRLRHNANDELRRSADNGDATFLHFRHKQGDPNMTYVAYKAPKRVGNKEIKSAMDRKEDLRGNSQRMAGMLHVRRPSFKLTVDEREFFLDHIFKRPGLGLDYQYNLAESELLFTGMITREKMLLAFRTDTTEPKRVNSRLSPEMIAEQTGIVLYEGNLDGVLKRVN